MISCQRTPLAAGKMNTLVLKRGAGRCVTAATKMKPTVLYNHWSPNECEIRQGGNFARHRQLKPGEFCLNCSCSKYFFS